MARIKAFSGIRPRKGLEARIAALPYDVYSREEAKIQVEKEPMSFLRIDRAETGLDDSVDVYDPKVYQRAHDLLWEMVEKGEFVREEKPCLYLYEQRMAGRCQTGLVACASVDDYLNQVIKKHENTRADKEADRIRHVDVCNAQTGPIFLAYRRQEALQEIFAGVKTGEPLFAFSSEDGVEHRGWMIAEDETVKRIIEIFGGMDSIYIADGHHRAASAVAVGRKRRAEKPGYTGEEEFNYFLSVLFPGEELFIMDYNRVVHDLNGLTEEEFLEAVEEKFLVEKCGEAYSPEKKGKMGMYLGNQWYALTVRKEYESDDPIEGLDVSILQREVLAPVLGITDPKTDSRIGFIGGIRGLSELERRVHTDCKAAFAMYPTSIEELYRVADQGLLMPPKSTWFEPKLRSGLFIHEL
ncbi:DUF1015 domain-containing protein [Hominisplanchenecus murintestinalis]|uniref:DUF1015 domain-containing protein n=1 Tax=Hominisplanchenecus murintestinalis TaxID=2941517 RepID=UPI000EA001FB|nr:DUF1015 family protein [Hominisplanchenecus murintestinalis]NBH97142.1 DUF1015 domain-containing protein [Lachnospiraceae bacterium]NBI75103.1 DUF1015 domain-containing protein [Lachnospiraceae bacterium]RKJ94046.1 DUF1015 domain-containing protein [Anaerotruncus sp. 1XD22-93]